MNTKEQKRKTLKQERWNKAYMETGSLSQASILAGYNIGKKSNSTKKYAFTKSASEIGRQNLEKFRREIGKERDKEGLSWLTPEYVLSSLNKLATNEKTPARSKISALELLGKSLALFTDKVETKNQILSLIGEITTDWNESGSTKITQDERKEEMNDTLPMQA